MEKIIFFYDIPVFFLWSFDLPLLITPSLDFIESAISVIVFLSHLRVVNCPRSFPPISTKVLISTSSYLTNLKKLFLFFLIKNFFLRNYLLSKNNFPVIIRFCFHPTSNALKRNMSQGESPISFLIFLFQKFFSILQIYLNFNISTWISRYIPRSHSQSFPNPV